jgi:hypothetical protein
MLCVPEETAIKVYATMWQHIQHHHHHHQQQQQQQQQRLKLEVCADLMSDPGDTDGESTSSNESKEDFAANHAKPSATTTSSKVTQQEAGFYFPRQLHRGPDAVGNQYYYTLKSKLQANEYVVLVESLWMHFLSNFSTSGTIEQDAFFDERFQINLVTQKARLPIFQSLSQGCHGKV